MPMQIPLRIGRGAGLNMAFGQILQNLMQGDEIARKREMQQMDFAMRLTDLDLRRQESQERLRMAKEAREERETKRRSLEEWAQRMYAQPAERFQAQAAGLRDVAASSIPSALDTEDGDTAPGPLAQGVSGSLEEQAKRLLAQQSMARAFPDQFGKAVIASEFRDPLDADLKRSTIYKNMREGQPKAPIIRRFLEGDKEVEKQWDHARQTWVPISTPSPRWKPEGPQKPQSSIGKLIADLRAAEASGDKQLARAVKDEIKNRAKSPDFRTRAGLALTAIARDKPEDVPEEFRSLTRGQILALMQGLTGAIIGPDALSPKGGEMTPDQMIQMRNAPMVNTPEEAQQLPPGTVYRTPDGRMMRR